MRKDYMLSENPHKEYNNNYEPQEQVGEPQAGSKKVKQRNHSRQIQTREG